MESVKQLVMRVLGMDYKGKCIREVLEAFKSMGASDEDLKLEKKRLTEDEMYLAEWSVAVNPKRFLDVHGDDEDNDIYRHRRA